MNPSTEKAIEQVELNNQEYYDMALAFAIEWLKTRMQSFTSEDLKDALYASGIPAPREPRVFGAVINNLKNQKLIKHKGYTQYKAAVGHNRPSSVWISLAYRKKQQSNAKAVRKAQTQLKF